MTRRQGGDDVPSIEAAEAEARRDREQAEALVAGFDRSGRRPRRERSVDFIAHYGERARHREAAPPEGPAASPAAARRVYSTTAVIPRGRALAAWVPWAVATLMVTFGGLVAYVATSVDPAPHAGVATAPSATSVTTLTSGGRPPARDLEIPPPDERGPEDTAPPPDDAVHAPSPSTVHAPRSAPSTTERSRTMRSRRKPSVREDFIRDL